MKVLVELDAGLLQLVDAEARAAGAGAGVPRLKVVRELIVEGLRARAAGRGEEFPEVEAWRPQDELAAALRAHECTDRCVPAAVCGRASLTPGYAPCRRPPHEEGPCAHERAPQILSSCWISGQDMIGVDSSMKEGTIIVSRPVRTAHEVVTCSVSDEGLDRLRRAYPDGIPPGEVITLSGDEIESRVDGRVLDYKTRSSGKAESKTVSEIASLAQTVAEERMRDRVAKPV
jgi:hypothetical protein